MVGVRKRKGKMGSAASAASATSRVVGMLEVGFAWRREVAGEIWTKRRTRGKGRGNG